MYFQKPRDAQAKQYRQIFFYKGFYFQLSCDRYFPLRITSNTGKDRINPTNMTRVAARTSAIPKTYQNDGLRLKMDQTKAPAPAKPNILTEIVCFQEFLESPTAFGLRTKKPIIAGAKLPVAANIAEIFQNLLASGTA